MAEKKYIDEEWKNPAERAKRHLESLMKPHGVLGDAPLTPQQEGHDFSPASLGTSSEATIIDVADARREAPLLTQESERQKIRLLLLTKDETVLSEGSTTYERIANGRNLFLESHIVLFLYDKEKKDTPPLRLFENVWVYSVYASSWWMLCYRAYTLTQSQLVFSGGCRADIIVAEDPFETGLVGWWLCKKYNRPFQLHLRENFFDKSFIESLDHPTLYAWSLEHVVRHVQSIRTKTEHQRQAIVEEFPEHTSVTECIPNYYDLKAWRDFAPTTNLHDEYPQFKFLILHITSMRVSSHSREVLLGVSKILRMYPTVGLIMVGNGPLRSMLEQQTLALGLEKQVEFRPMPQETISLMKSAHVLIHLGEDGEEDDLILEAAVVKLPLIGSTKGLARELFTDNESACLCSPTDIECIAGKVNQYLNENRDRARLSLSASDIVFERIEQDYNTYLTAYAESIERGIVPVP